MLSVFRAKSGHKFVQKLVHQTILVMKNNVMQIFTLVALLLIACSFAPASAPSGGAIKNTDAAIEVPVGGAHLIFAGKFGGEISKKEMSGQTELKVDGCARGSRIFEYTIHITKGGKTNKLSNRSNVLTSEMLAALNSLSKGDAFEFRNTKAYLPNGKDVVDVHTNKFVVV